MTYEYNTSLSLAKNFDDKSNDIFMSIILEFTASKFKFNAAVLS